MPLERVPTPRPTLRKANRTAEYHEYATSFLKSLSDFLIKDKGAYKLFLFVYMTIMILFVFAVESDTYKVKMMGNEIFAAVVLIEMALGFASCAAVYGIVNTRYWALTPLLLLQVIVLIYGFCCYMYPFTYLKYFDALEEIELDYSLGNLLWTCIKLTSIFLLRLSPLLVQLGFVFYTVKVIFCLVLVKYCDAKVYLPIHNRSSSVNSHVWSSIRRKISARQSQDNASQTSTVTLPDPDLICEMSAKFKKDKYPQAQFRDGDIC